MQPWRRLRWLARRCAGRLTAGRDLRRLSAAQDPRVKLVAAAVESAIAGKPSREEKAWIDRIESIRARLLASDESIAVTDYGAGRAQDRRTPEQMEQGVTVQMTKAACCRASKPPRWAYLLFKLVRTLRPQHCLELGTCVGISAAYQTAALALNGEGRFITLEGSEALAALAQSHLQGLGFGRCDVVVGRFQKTLPALLQQGPPFDHAFIDGHHDEVATRAYFEQIKPYLAGGALVVFDDIAWSPGMERAWQAISNDSHVTASIDLGNVGLCLVATGPTTETRRFSFMPPF